MPEFDFGIGAPLVPDVAEEFDPAELLMAPLDLEEEEPAFELPAQFGTGALDEGPLVAPPGLLSIEDEEPAPSLEELDFAPQAVDPATMAKEDALAYRDLGRRRSEVVSAIGGIDARAATEQDPAARAALQQDRAGLLGTLSEVDTEKQAAGDRQKMAIAGLEEQAQVAAADASLAAAETMQAEAARISEASRARTEELDRRAESARAEQETSRRRYQAVLRAGPGQKLVGSVLAEVLGETIQAAVDNRVPNYGAITERAFRRDQAVFATESQAAAQDVELTGDLVADQADERRRAIAEEESQRAAMLREVTGRAELEIQRARTPLAKARASEVFTELQNLADAADAKAGQARVEAMERAEKSAMARKLDMAKLGKLGAETAKLEAGTSKLLRQGRGGSRRPVETAGLFRPNQVAFPGTEDLALTIGGDNPTKEDTARATKIRTSVNYYGSLLKRINGLEAKVEDAGEAAVFGTRFDRTGEWGDMESIIGDLEPDVAKIGSGGFAATESDMKWAKENLPKVPNAWDTKEKALVRVRALKRRLRDRARFAYGTFGMKPALAEKFVGKMEKFSTSRADVSKRDMADAERIVRDKGKTATDRKAALDAIEEKARAELGHDYLGNAGHRIISALPDIDDDEVRQDAYGRVAKYIRFAGDRAKQIVESDPTLSVMIQVGVPREKMDGHQRMAYDLYQKELATAEKLRQQAKAHLLADVPEDVKEFFRGGK